MESRIITLKPADRPYPELLRQIADPPKQLYCRGDISILSTKCFAVVGTRKLTSYGKEACQTITGGLVRVGLTIVSGLAFGIDAVAHQSAVDAGGKTIAVLGGGVDDESVGPKTNLPLARNILKSGGLLISEYEAGSEIFPANFAIRDRIISGLSIGVLVVEADVDSGSLITAKCALDQNRDVFAVPGGIFATKSLGSNTLIKNGAKLVTTATDIIEEYSPDHFVFGEKPNYLSTNDPIQKAILAILNTKGQLSIDVIISETNIPSPKIMSTLSIMELSGLVNRLSDGKYCLNKR
jgi:DNA processing protein